MEQTIKLGTVFELHGNTFKVIDTLYNDSHLICVEIGLMDFGASISTYIWSASYINNTAGVIIKDESHFNRVMALARVKIGRWL